MKKLSRRFFWFGIGLFVAGAAAGSVASSFVRLRPIAIVPVVPSSATSTQDAVNPKPSYALRGESFCPPYQALIEQAPNPVPCYLGIKRDLPLVRVELTARKTTTWDYAYITSMDVIQKLDGKEKKQILQLPGRPDVPMLGSFLDNRYLLHLDLNFDGYEDLMLRMGAGATGNTSYAVWLYDPKTAGYVYSDAVSRFTTPEVYPSEKVLSSHSNGGASFWTFEYYKWQAGKLVQIGFQSNEYRDYSQWREDPKVICTTGHLLNGEMVTSTKEGGCDSWWSGRK
jgi:hypothetical protein